MFTFEVNKNNIELTEAETITSGSVNVYFCNFTFSPDWDGLAKTITFRAGDVSISVLLDSTNMCTIPWEVLQTDAVQLYCGVRGTVTDTDTEEEAVIPTVYCLLGTIRKGTELGDNAQPPVPSVVEQIMNRIEALDEGKQDKLTGQFGQVVSFDEFGNVIARDEKGTEYKAGANIEISADNTISAKMYDDTEIRGEINSVKSKTEANSTGIAKNTAGINKNASDIAKNSADIAKNTESIAGNAVNIAKNSADIAKNAADVKTVGDKVDTLNTSFSTLSSSVTDNTTAITTSEENIAALSLSVTAAGQEIAKNTSGLSAANTKISELSASKQDKLTGEPGQVVGFDANGNPIAQEGGSGTPGKDGTTFTPMVSPEGVISWTNDGGKENPKAVNIKGPKGDPGEYTAGDNVHIEGNVISATSYDDTAIRSSVAALETSKQDKLTAGNNVHIEGNVISSDMYDDTAIRSSVTALETSKQDKLTAGNNVHIEGNVISATSYDDTAIRSSVAALETSKQDKLHGTEGQVVSFDEFGNVISRDERGTEYKAGENISISADNTISAKMYDDTEIRAEIDNVKSKTAENAEAIEANAAGVAANAEGIAANAAGIAKNSAGVTKNAADIAKNSEAIAGNTVNIAKNSADISANTANISKNTADIAKNTAGLKTVSDKVDTLNTSFSNLSKSVTDNTNAINTVGEDIAALSSSVATATEEIAKNTAGLSAANEEILTLKDSKQDKLHGNEGQVVGFDKDGNAIAQDGGAGTPGKDGVTFTPMVSESGIISWSNDGGRENPEPMNIKGPKGDKGDVGPAGTYAAGAGIAITNDAIALKDTASTKYQAGAAEVKSISGFNRFTFTSQTSEIRSIVEYLKTASSGGEGAITFRTMYGYAEVSVSANRSWTLSPASPIGLIMSASVSYKGAAGFAIITHGENKYIALVYADSDYLYVYPTQTISIAQSDTLSIQLYVH